MRIGIKQAKRLPQGSFLGYWRQHTAPQLGGLVLKDLYENCQQKPQGIVMGNVVQAGLGQAPVRQSAHLAGISPEIPCMAINKVCASGMKAIHLACMDILHAGGTWLAGGMESMTNTPYLWPRQSQGRVGKPPAQDSLMFDGLQDGVSGQSMGILAEATAKSQGITRAMQEEFAYQSLQNAKKASDEKVLQEEMVHVEGITLVDEPLTKIKEEKFFALSPAFGADGTITAATASSLADGASGLELSGDGDDALAYIVGVTEFSCLPADFTRAPLGAMDKLLAQTGWKISDVDIFEINEAFATVPVMAMKHFDISRDRVNIYGGACNLGHPLGSSGARIVVTLAHAMKRTGAKRGIASLCVGGGEAMALALQRA